MVRRTREVEFGRLCLPALVAAALFLSSAAHAQVIISAESVAATAGSTGNALDITLTNSTGSPVGIAAFAFEVVVGSTDIKFTDANFSTADPYIFAGDSFDQNTLSSLVTSNTGQDLAASDLSFSSNGASVGAGATVGLGHLIFDVSNSASGSYPVFILPFPNTSLSDANFNDVAFTISDGAIRVSGGGGNAPEPGSAALLLGAAVTGILFYRRRR